MLPKRNKSRLKKRGRHQGRRVTAETAALVAPREAGRRLSFGWLWSAALLVLLTFLVIYPVAMLLLGALTNTNPVLDGFGIYDLSLKNFITVLGNPNVHLALALSDYAYVIAEGRPFTEGQSAKVAAMPEIRQAYLGL